MYTADSYFQVAPSDESALKYLALMWRFVNRQATWLSQETQKIPESAELSDVKNTTSIQHSALVHTTTVPTRSRFRA
jgi:hypothetical protein